MLPLVLPLLAVAALVSVLIPLVFGAEVYRARRGVRHVTCPETRHTVAVRVDAAHSVATALSGPEYVRLASCTRWPSRQDCDQDCVPDLLRQPEHEEAAAGGIAHLPVVVGTAAAWLLGAIWYARPVFGRAWMQAHALTPQAARARASMILPYLLPLGGFLVLGYFVAWHISRRGRAGLGRGLLLGALLGLLYVTVDWLLRLALPGPRLPLSWVEQAYVVAGCGLTAAIVSGWGTLRNWLAFG